jgi:arylsulfatase A-like enzyme
MDAQLGRILNALEENGLKDKTIVIFTSDHGYHMGEHGYYQKLTLFEDSDRVPLIISYPGQTSKSQTTQSMVEMIDFYPTLSELAGITVPSFVAGKSMLPILEDPHIKIRETALTQLVNGYSLRTDNYRFTRWLDGGNDMLELYDRKRDPAEMENLAGKPKYKQKVQELNKLLSERIKAASEKPVGLTVIPFNKNK